MKSKNGNTGNKGVPEYSGFGKIVPVGGYDDEELEDHIDEKIRLTRDLIEASRTMGSEEARYLVDAYYATQENRKRTDNQVRALGVEPHFLIQWLSDKNRTLEHQIGRALDTYTQAHPMGDWMRCAPGYSEVWIEHRKRVKISELVTGDNVISFDRRHARLTRPQKIEVSSRPYKGTMIEINTDDHRTETTPNHKWLIRFNRKETGVTVYLMQSGERFRVGRTSLFGSRKEGSDQYWRLGVQHRARNERASVWILQIFSTDREAAIYEHFVSAEYGITETVFKENRPGGALGFTQYEIDSLFGLLDKEKQLRRAIRCLRDHGRDIRWPLYSWGDEDNIQSPTQGIVTHATNLIADVMQVPLPTPVYSGVDWLDIKALNRNHFEGPVYSMDVANHHKYIQDGLITNNSIVGIGPVLSAGLLAHIDMARCPTVGHIWQFAGIAGPVAEPASRYASYRIDFGTEIDPNKPPSIVLADDREATPYFPDGPTAYVYRITVGTQDAPLATYKGKTLSETTEPVSCEIQYKYLGQKPWEKGMKRPFNATLKVICWKIGQSFMKLSNREDCYYGRTYRDRKAYEIANNEAGILAEQAAKALPHFRKTTEAYKWYEKGMLPPAHIDARARRYAVKLFLSHMHGEWHEKFFGKPAPLPYPIAHLQHVHFIPPSVGQTKTQQPQPIQR